MRFIVIFRFRSFPANKSALHEEYQLYIKGIFLMAIFNRCLDEIHLERKKDVTRSLVLFENLRHW